MLNSPLRYGGSNLGKIIVSMTPERCPPCLVQFFNIMVKLFRQIILEPLYTVRTLTFPAKFIGNMLHQKSRMISEFICQLIDDHRNLFYDKPVHSYSGCAAPRDVHAPRRNPRVCTPDMFHPAMPGALRTASPISCKCHWHIISMMSCSHAK